MGTQTIKVAKWSVLAAIVTKVTWALEVPVVVEPTITHPAVCLPFLQTPILVSITAVVWHLNGEILEQAHTSNSNTSQ